ncbi:MAG: hypothetical protein IKE56_02160 [Lachnospiraceae bacterium]|nr:hypothetical protein [Lachnospiraceae bacterium]
MKKLIAVIAGIAAAVMMTCTAFAGEWVNENGRWFYNTGYDYVLTGWNWIYETDGLARCYYFDSTGCCLTGAMTPDGYLVNNDGAWVSNGQVVTKGYESGMHIETDYSRAGGRYHTTSQRYADGSINTYGPDDFPVDVYFDGGCYVVSYYGDNQQSTEFFANYFTRYSYESQDRQKKLDFIDENNFRIIDNTYGTETCFSR